MENRQLFLWAIFTGELLSCQRKYPRAEDHFHDSTSSKGRVHGKPFQHQTYSLEARWRLRYLWAMTERNNIIQLQLQSKDMRSPNFKSSMLGWLLRPLRTRRTKTQAFKVSLDGFWRIKMVLCLRFRGLVYFIQISIYIYISIYMYEYLCIYIYIYVWYIYDTCHYNWYYNYFHCFVRDLHLFASKWGCFIQGGEWDSPDGPLCCRPSKQARMQLGKGARTAWQKASHPQHSKKWPFFSFSLMLTFDLALYLTSSMTFYVAVH